MRLTVSVLLLLFLSSTLAFAVDDPMEVQRCVWSCLANSKETNDPAYEKCVQQNCAEEKPATKQKKKSKYEQ